MIKLQRDARPAPGPDTGLVVAIGNFDGVHPGHQAVIAAARARAEAQDRPLGVLTFEPHPRSLFRPADPPFRLTGLRDKAILLDRLGVQRLIVPRFTRQFAALPAEQFVTDYLHRAWGVRHLVVGHDFCFGRARTGTPERLAAWAGALGIGVDIVAPILAADGQPYGSTRVRAALAEGQPEQAARLLGRPFTVSGHVQHGDRYGHALGFPTANLPIAGYLHPRPGIYAMTVSGAGLDRHPAVGYLGNRPAVGGDEFRFEVHLLDFSGDLYGRRLSVTLDGFLRADRNFSDMAALATQIAADVATARAWFAGQSPIGQSPVGLSPVGPEAS